MTPLWLSLRVATTATLISAVLGTSIAFVLAKKRFPGRALLEGVTVLPLVMPPTVLGYYLLVALAPQSRLGVAYRWLTGADLTFSLSGIVIAACVAGIPLLIRQAQTAFSAVDGDLEDAARTLGAGEWGVFRHVTAPLALPGLIAGAVLCFARALGDFGATLMVGGNFPGRTRTLSLEVYSLWEAGDDRTASWLCLLLAGVALTIAVAAAQLARRR